MGFFTLLMGSLAGAGLMFFLDPNTGVRRRSQLRDRLAKMGNTTSDRVEIMVENAGNRARETAVEVKNRLQADEPSDEKSKAN